MANIEKFLRRLSYEERQKVKGVLIKIFSNDIQKLDIKKLKGYKNIYRVRKGDVRIVFSKEEDIFDVVFIGRRGDSEYNRF